MTGRPVTAQQNAGGDSCNSNEDSDREGESSDFFTSGLIVDAYTDAIIGRDRLKFTADLEQQFQKSFQKRDWAYIRMLHAALLALYVVYGVFDFMLLQSDVLRVWLIRYCVALPLLILLFVAGRDRRVIRYQQGYLVLGMSILMLTTLWMIDIVPLEDVPIYLASLLAMVMGGLTMARMRFWYVVACSVIYLASSFAMLVPAFVGWSPLTYFLMLDAGAVVFCCVGAYAYEHALRREFLQQTLIEHQNRQLANVNDRLKALVEIDALTGIYNRRYLDNALDDEWRRARRRDYCLSLLMCDIDYFKLYNDTVGHVNGDQCIKAVAQGINELFRRPGDVVARYGGEEFAVLLPELSGEEAMHLANAVCEQVRKLAIPHPASKVAEIITVSVGVAELRPTEATELRDLVRMADDALYRAKRSGRNHAEMFAGVLPAHDAV